MLHVQGCQPWGHLACTPWAQWACPTCPIWATWQGPDPRGVLPISGLPRGCCKPLARHLAMSWTACSTTSPSAPCARPSSAPLSLARYCVCARQLDDAYISCTHIRVDDRRRHRVCVRTCFLVQHGHGMLLGGQGDDEPRPHCKDFEGCRGRGEELLGMLAKPSAKTNATQQKFRTEGGPAVREYCPHLTKEDCRRCVHG